MSWTCQGNLQGLYPSNSRGTLPTVAPHTPHNNNDIKYNNKEVRYSVQPETYLINKCTTSFSMKVGVLFLYDLLVCLNYNTLMFTTVFRSCIAKLIFFSEQASNRS